MRSFPLLIAALLFVMQCRGREYLTGLPAYRSSPAKSVIILRAETEGRRDARLVIVEPDTGTATEVNSPQVPVAQSVKHDEIIAERDLLLTRSGSIWSLKDSDAAGRTYTGHQLSPDGRHLLARGGNAIFVTPLFGEGRMQATGQFRDCRWVSAAAVACIEGPYQKETRLVQLSLPQLRRSILVETQGEYLRELATDPVRGSIAYATQAEKLVRFWLRSATEGRAKILGELPGHYVFALAVSSQGTVAARVASAERSAELLLPQNIWFSGTRDHRQGLLLDLPALAHPGFFSGAGFQGVEAFDFSPDGTALAILMSSRDGCRMADEGGNLACRLNVFTYEIPRGSVRQLTHFKASQLNGIAWRTWSRLTE